MQEKKSLLTKIIYILKPETSFFVVSIIYGLVASLLTLAIPISVQSLVNTVSFGVLIQPIIVLSILLLSLLIVSGSLNALQIYVIELFQRRFYVRMISEFSQKLLKSDVRNLQEQNGVELVNRYFDLMTIQKSVTTLVSGGMAIILQTIAGLILLALYHPYFLIFDFILIVLIFFAFAIFTKKAVYSANMESKAKYKTAAWLEEIARENLYFKTDKRRKQAFTQSDSLINNYLHHREKHFSQVFSQKIFLLIIYAFMSAFILGLGGVLVIQGQLSIGQLVAAELVTTIILASFSKASKYLEAFYDLHAATEKVYQFYELEEEVVSTTSEKIQLPIKTLNFENIEINNIQSPCRFNQKFDSDKFYYVHAQYSSTRQTFFEILQILRSPTKGTFYLNEQPVNTLNSTEVRDHLIVVDKPSVFTASLKDNLIFGLKDVSLSRIREALEVVGLESLEKNLLNGLDTMLQTAGRPLWDSQLIRLSIARAILSKPEFMILGPEFDHIGDKPKQKILEYFRTQNIGFILFSSSLYPSFQFSEYYALTENGFKQEQNLEAMLNNINENLDE